MAAVARDVVDWVRRYAAHPDPRVETANFFALLVASNQPFYPLYLHWLVGNGVCPSLLTFLSTPFFLAVPALARHFTRAGRALLPIAGMANTVLCAKLFGVASAVEIFLVPCVMLALLLFRPNERAISFSLVGIALAAYWLLHDSYGAPVVAYSPAEYAALSNLNILSAITLTACIALVFSNVLAKAERHDD